jgi:hypothetical protein
VILSGLHYIPKDIYRYIKGKEWKKFKGYGIKVFAGLFGSGKSQSAVDYVVRMYHKYHVNIISNIKLFGVPYTPLENYQQIIDSSGNTIILIDEISTVFNAREWQSFNIDLLFQLLQVRKNRKMLITTAQRFEHVEKLIRDVTVNVIKCKKYWRYCVLTCYDAWDYEHTPLTVYLEPIYKVMYFSTDALYNSYDTSEIIDNMKKQKFISNKEVLYQNKDLRKVYSDYNFDSFIDRCREMLGDIWDDTTNIEIPF